MHGARAGTVRRLKDRQRLPWRHACCAVTIGMCGDRDVQLRRFGSLVGSAR
jgi:hypothetical protein